MNERNKTAVVSRPRGAYEDKIRAILDEMTLDEKISQITESWGIAGAERVGVPPLYKGECVHGYSYGTGCTVFPQAIAMAATWSRDTVHEIGHVTGVESKAANAYQAWSPVLDVAIPDGAESRNPSVRTRTLSPRSVSHGSTDIRSSV